MLGYDDIKAAAGRIEGQVRPAALAAGGPRLSFALEFLQYTGSFKARGALNFTAAHLESAAVPEAGIAIASGGNAGLACAWAAGRRGIPATVFLPVGAPAVKVALLRELGAEVRQVGAEYAEAAAACAEFTAATGALASHAYDHPLIAAGAGTLLEEILAARPGTTTVLVAVGGGGLFAGVAAAAAAHGVRVVAVEPERCRALHAALAAGAPVDVPVDSVAADSLGARRVSADALYWAGRPHAASVLVPDAEIVAARRALWHEHRLAVEHAAATAWAALRCGAYVPAPAEEVCVVLCGANTDPADLGHGH
ncbi:serine/threonine dehydratase [Streptomyces hoynatensis]|uniref:Pyridoxal-phosphate dependent enzyme n=1 Tax=Streptomyces hoynatensis TaxID=1141874 RepID=A0A3A9YXV7_9ACTN|nr:serine/threonine dehydratase [Streptomyces hoynatensis]RKN40868.1 pyridoxal-phosphate dependent enzyme [Streptomyces hoynatensis]